MKLTCPLPDYTYCHAVISVTIALLLAPLIGVMWGGVVAANFYGWREVLQWVEKGYWDRPGFVSGVLPPLVVALLIGGAHVA